MNTCIASFKPSASPAVKPPRRATDRGKCVSFRGHVHVDIPPRGTHRRQAVVFLSVDDDRDAAEKHPAVYIPASISRLLPPPACVEALIFFTQATFALNFRRFFCFRFVYIRSFQPDAVGISVA